MPGLATPLLLKKRSVVLACVTVCKERERTWETDSSVSLSWTLFIRKEAEEMRSENRCFSLAHEKAATSVQERGSWINSQHTLMALQWKPRNTLKSSLQPTLCYDEWSRHRVRVAEGDHLLHHTISWRTTADPQPSFHSPANVPEHTF